MSFFDDFKRTAQDVANKTAKKTGELTNIAKLNMNLKTNEAKFNEVCTEIGKMFYEAQRSGADYTSEIAASVMKLDKISLDIDSCKKEIAKLRKVAICPECGKEISDEALFCQYCGAKQIKPEPECDCCCEEACESEECACGCCCDCCDECDDDEETIEEKIEAAIDSIEEKAEDAVEKIEEIITPEDKTNE